MSETSERERGKLHQLFDANFLDYTSYVIRERAIPDVDDGPETRTAAHPPDTVQHG